jgi:hypothetical protein
LSKLLLLVLLMVLSRIRPTTSIGTAGRSPWAKRQAISMPPLARDFRALNEPLTSGSVPLSSSLLMGPVTVGSKRKRTSGEQLEVDRSCARDAAFEASGETINGYLRRRTVKPTTTRRYQVYSDLFVHVVGAKGLETKSLTDIDANLDKYLTDLYMNGKQLAYCRTMSAAVAWTHLCRPRDFKVSQTTLKDHSNNSPASSQDPATWEEACLIARDLAAQNMSFEAAAVLLQFDTLGRPGSLFKLQGRHSIPPSSSSGTAFRGTVSSRRSRGTFQ